MAVKKITTTRAQLVKVFSEWNEEYYKQGTAPALKDFADEKLAERQADDLIQRLGNANTTTKKK